MITAEQVKEKGYDFCVQPTRTDQYSLEEFRDLILRFNELKPYGLYIVDTFGLFTKKRFLEYVEVADRYLNPDIALGYHAHNNLHQAVGNAPGIHRAWAREGYHRRCERDGNRKRCRKSSARDHRALFE